MCVGWGGVIGAGAAPNEGHAEQPLPPASNSSQAPRTGWQAG